MALAYAPLAVVRQTFHIFEAASDPRLTTIFQYFEQTWIRSIQPRMWNVHGVAIKTNNDCEGWHNRFQNLVDKHRPNIWRLLDCILQEQNATEIMKQQILAGQVVTSRNTRYKKIHLRLKRLLRRYRRGNLTLTNYITGVSHNLAAF